MCCAQPSFTVPTAVTTFHDTLDKDKLRRRSTDRFRIFSCHTGTFRDDQPCAVADHICGPWHVICLQQNAGSPTSQVFNTRSTLPRCCSTRTRTIGTSSAFLTTPRRFGWAGTVPKTCGGRRLPLHDRENAHQQQVRLPAFQLPPTCCS